MLLRYRPAVRTAPATVQSPPWSALFTPHKYQALLCVAGPRGRRLRTYRFVDRRNLRELSAAKAQARDLVFG
jgi:hypothetical protein